MAPNFVHGLIAIPLLGVIHLIQRRVAPVPGIYISSGHAAIANLSKDYGLIRMGRGEILQGGDDVLPVLIATPGRNQFLQCGMRMVGKREISASTNGDEYTLRIWPIVFVQFAR